MTSCWAVMDFSQYSSSFLDVVVEKKFSDRQFGVRKKGVIKEDTRFIGIHLLVKVLSSRKEVGDRIWMTGNVGQFIVEILQILDPVGLSTSNFLRLTEVLEIFVVGANFDGLSSAKEERAATFKSKQDGCEFLIMGIIVLFGGEETAGVEGNGEDTVIELLRDDGSEGISRGVCFKDKAFGPVGATKRRECSARIFQALEGLLFAFCPLPLAILAREVI
jgi:hypothetical protein